MLERPAHYLATWTPVDLRTQAEWMLDNAQLASSRKDAARLRSRAARLLELAATFEDKERDRASR